MAERRGASQSWEIERSLLGGLLLDPARLTDARERLNADCFQKAAHAALFELMCVLADRNQPPELSLVLDELGRRDDAGAFGGIAYVADLPGACPSVVMIPQFVDRVHDHSQRRRLTMAAEGILARVKEGVASTPVLLDEAERAVLEISKLSGPTDWHPLATVVDEHIREIEERAKNPGHVVGVPTGFIDRDKKLAGMHSGQLIVLAARPAMGKTALALNFALNAATRGGAAVGIFSLEMSRHELVSRMLCSEALVDAGHVRTGQLDDGEWRRLIAASERLRDVALEIDDQSGLTIMQLRSKARRLKIAHPDLKLIVVDYLQLMEGSGNAKESRENVISTISRGLKVLAKELGITVLALSQLNRSLETRPNKRPMPSDLRESGAIEQDADVILFIYREEIYKPDTPDKGIAEVIIAKQRGGETGTVKLAFRGEYTLFQSLAQDRDVPGGYA